MDIKTQEYKIAIEKYNHIAWYTRIEFITAMIIIALQIASTIKLIQNYQTSSVVFTAITLLIAYMTTDFINGVVHMLMDNNTNYQSIFGPFIAAFHMHHSKLIYKNNHILKIYFYETGHKLWLVFYLLIISILQWFVHLNSHLDLLLVAIGIFSSFAELSHYWCHHQSQCNWIIRALQKYRILLSMQHHKFHHNKDNTHYAFLNGMSDYFLNIIATLFCKGYKNRSDRYVADYQKNLDN